MTDRRPDHQASPHDLGGRSHVPVLSVAVATTSGRSSSILPERLPRGPLWTYTIYCQVAGDPLVDAAAARYLSQLEAARPDISVAYLEGRGAARSRNAALAATSMPLLLFADDDASLLESGLESIIREFNASPGLAMLAGQTIDSHGKPLKSYPERTGRLTAFNSGKIGTIELAVRPALVRGAGVTFDEGFGAGQENYIGDEYIFVTDCLKAGLDGSFVPVPIAVHPPIYAASEWTTPHSAKARARALERVFGAAAGPAKLAFLWRHRRRFATNRQFLEFAGLLMKRQPTQVSSE